jgi:hypothetical protein
VYITGRTKDMIKRTGRNIYPHELEEFVRDIGVIFVVNHSSYLDGVVLSAAISGELSFVAKGELAGQAVAGPFLRRIGTLFVHRLDPKAGVENAEVIIVAARPANASSRFLRVPLCACPGFSASGWERFWPRHRPASRSFPVAIRCTQSILRGGQWLPRRGAISVNIDPTIMPGAGLCACALSRTQSGPRAGRYWGVGADVLMPYVIDARPLDASGQGARTLIQVKVTGGTRS